MVHRYKLRKAGILIVGATAVACSGDLLTAAHQRPLPADVAPHGKAIENADPSLTQYVGAAADSFNHATAQRWARAGDSTFLKQLLLGESSAKRAVDSARTDVARRSVLRNIAPRLGASAQLSDDDTPPIPEELTEIPAIATNHFTVQLNSGVGVATNVVSYRGTSFTTTMSYQQSDLHNGTASVPRSIPLTVQSGSLQHCVEDVIRFRSLAACTFTQTQSATVSEIMKANCEQKFAASAYTTASWDFSPIAALILKWIRFLSTTMTSPAVTDSEISLESPRCVGPTFGITASAQGGTANAGQTLKLSSKTPVDVQLAFSGIRGSNNVTNFVWSSSGVGTVGGASGVVDARAPLGTTTYSLVASDTLALSASGSVTVIVATGPTITLPTTATVATRMKASSDCQSTEAWASSNPSIATVNSTGVIAAVGLGHVTISVTCDGFTGYADMSVVDEDGNGDDGSGNAGGAGGECVYGEWWHSENGIDGWIDMGEVCYATKNAVSRPNAGIVRLDLAKNAVQPLEPPPSSGSTPPRTCWYGSPSLCSLVPTGPAEADGPISQSHPYLQGGRPISVGGEYSGSTQYEWRYNGVVVSQGTATSTATVPPGPIVRNTAPPGSDVPITLTETDGTGTTLTASTIVHVYDDYDLQNSSVRRPLKSGKMPLRLPDSMKPQSMVVRQKAQ